MLNCFSNPKWKKTKISRSFDQLAVLFQRKFSEVKVKSESFDRFVKTNQQNETKMKQWKAVYYSLLVDPCKRIDTNEHKTSYLQLNLLWITWGDQHKHNERNLYRKLQLRNPKEDSKHKENCGRRKAIYTKNTNELDCCGPWVKLNGQHKAQKWKQSGLGFESTQKWNSFEKENSTQNDAHKKIDCGSECRSTQLNWMDTEKNEALAAKFQR